jgi:hypothetical protein
MGYHEPPPPPWVIVYWVFILEYSWNILNNFLKKSFKIFKIFVILLLYGLHLKFAKKCDCQKNSSPFASPFIILKHWLQCFQNVLKYFSFIILISKF